MTSINMKLFKKVECTLFSHLTTVKLDQNEHGYNEFAFMKNKNFSIFLVPKKSLVHQGST